MSEVNSSIIAHNSHSDKGRLSPYRLHVRQTARALYNLYNGHRGANVIPTGGHTLNDRKQPLINWADWQTDRQKTSDVLSFPWERATGLAVMSGVNGWRVLDIDAHKGGGRVEVKMVNRLLAALGLGIEYEWVWRSGGGGVGIALFCDDDELSDELNNDKRIWWWESNKTDASYHHIEARWANGYTLVPPSLHPNGSNYKWRYRNLPQTLPATLDPHLVTNALNQFGTVRESDRKGYKTPRRTARMTNGGNGDHKPDSALMEQIRGYDEWIKYAERFTGSKKGRAIKNTDPLGSKFYRITNGGGLFVSENGFYMLPAEGRGVGGDCFHLIAYVEGLNIDTQWDEVMRVGAGLVGASVPVKVDVGDVVTATIGGKRITGRVKQKRESWAGDYWEFLVNGVWLPRQLLEVQ
ncbi:MAG TPA: bifunctional DNA primase/polymerase [Anaerolineae bacterium]|nr:bifunctional DNA primase/polymerase [Anaerolineae bacterium]